MITDDIDHIARWRAIVAARREQHDAVCAVQRRTTDDYWARRAKSFRQFTKDASAFDDPLLTCVHRHLRPDDTVLDIGAGTGRHTVALAREARHVTALDPSAAMLDFLRGDLEDQGLTNVDVIEGGWPAVEAPEVDIAISAHVLYPIEDVVSFLQAMDGHARRLCFLHLMTAQPWFDQLDLWRAVHGEERRKQPTYIEAVNVLHQLGCYANVEITKIDIPRAFDNLDDAYERFAESVAVGEDAGEQQRLREALAERLTNLDDGRLGLPRRAFPLATVWWEAGALAAS